MGHLIVEQVVTVDGYAEDADGGISFFGAMGDDLTPNEPGQVELLERVDAILLGRRTYGMFADYWPKADPVVEPVAEPIARLPKYVASNTLQDPSWEGTTVLSGEAAERVAELTARPGRELQIHGSGAVARSLLRHGLIDRVHLLTFPVVLGAGQRLFDEGAEPTALRLLESRTTGTGAVIATYEPAGRPSYGSFALEDDA